MFEQIYDSLGKLESIYTTENGIQVPLVFDSKTKTFDESDRLTILLREWEKENGALDLSDRSPDPITLEQAKALKKQEIIEIAAIKQEELVAGFAPPEQASWSKKVSDSEAFLASGKIEDAGMILPEAIAICESKDENVIYRYTQGVAKTVLGKSKQMYAATATIAGTRTRLVEQIKAATTFEELNKITWN
jgi:hypothetical protein